jgi:ATP-dependent DNA helicase RecG
MIYKETETIELKKSTAELDEIPEIPVDAIREALVNSLCHRDYYAPESNKVAIFKNRIEIYNPGSFPEGLTPEDFINKEEQSVLRNPFIAETLYKCKDIEKWGSGLKRIDNDCKAQGVKVEFKVLKTGFIVIFYRPEEVSSRALSPTNSSATQKLPRNYPETTQKIFDLIRQNPRITRSQFAKTIGLTQEGIKYHLRNMQKKNLIHRIGPDRGGYWKIMIKES